MELDHNSHSVFLVYYHLVMVIKYRRKYGMAKYPKKKRSLSISHPDTDRTGRMESRYRPCSCDVRAQPKDGAP